MNIFALQKKRSVYFYIHPLAHLFGIAGAAQVFWEANALEPGLYQLQYLSYTKKINSAQGLSLANLRHFAELEINPEDLVVVPGVDLDTFLHRKRSNAEYQAYIWMNKLHEQGVQFCSIGSGSLILAESGLLNYKKCTSHWKCAKHFKKNFPKIKFVENKIFITDGNITTSAGMSANVDTILSIVEQHHGPVFASRLAKELLIFIRRFGQESQECFYLDYKSHLNPVIHQIQNIISANLAENYTNAHLAELAHMSERNLTRIFKKEIGISITEFKNSLRLKLAQHLLYNKKLTINQIAAQCGFADARQLYRIWKKEFGKPLAASYSDKL